MFMSSSHRIGYWGVELSWIFFGLTYFSSLIMFDLAWVVF